MSSFTADVDSEADFSANLCACADAAIQAGTAAEEVGNLDAAFVQYQDALRLWLQAIKVEKKDPAKIKRNLEIYMTKAESIKQTLNARQAEVTTRAKEAETARTAARSKAGLTDYTSEYRKLREDAAKKKATTPQRKPAVPTQAGRGRGAAGAGKPAAVGAAIKVPAFADPMVQNEYENQIRAEMLDTSPSIGWDDISGLAFAKQTLQEAVILPNLRPDLFTGLRSPPKGVLLYGPPGTGKTMLAKAVATESGFSFFNISASSVTSKYLGEGEKLIKGLFSLARAHQPSVIFFDEIDALMSARKESEHEASRRLKTEFMVQVDGAATTATDRILIIGATNIPWDIDEAVLRRLVKRIYVPLPDAEARQVLITHMMSKHVKGGGTECVTAKKTTLARIVHMTQGYSGSDLTAVCKEAAMGPIREVSPALLRTLKAEDVRPISEQDFAVAISNIRPSVSSLNLEAFTKWSATFGTVR